LVDISKNRIDVNFLRISYDIQSVAQSIIESGLPYYFAEKLLAAK